jgi:hypothetical protein
MTMVDHTPMRGSRRMTGMIAELPRSIANIGSAIRHVVDARVSPDQDAAGAALAAPVVRSRMTPYSRVRGFGVCGGPQPKFSSPLV